MLLCIQTFSLIIIGKNFAAISNHYYSASLTDL